MKATLPGGQEVFVAIHHTEEEERASRQEMSDGASEVVSRRCTKVFLTKGEQVYAGKASCSLLDNFCKLTGRKMALTRALQTGDFSKEERRALFQLVCPKFYKNVSK